jgi:hypothetical protein
MARRYLAVPREQDRAIIPAPTGSNYYFTIVYNKGAWVLHMLRWVLGDSVFFRVLNAHATGFRDSSVTVDMFRRVAEQTSGRSLDWFFNEWLYDVGAPAYLGSWRSESLGPGNQRLTIVVRQIDAFFDMPIPLSVFSIAGRQDTSIRVSRAADTLILTIPVSPDSVVLDRDDWVLDRGMRMTEIVESPTTERTPPRATIVHGVLSAPASGVARQASSVLLDISGRKVLDLQPGPNDVSRLAPGVYLVRLEPSAAAKVVVAR